MLTFFFWMSRNLNVRNYKEKQTCFAKTPREYFFMTRHAFNTNSYANTMILVDKFVAGLSSFGYDCYKIVGSHLNLENKECNSFLQMFIE